MNYFKNLSEEQNRLNLKSEKVELALMDDLARNAATFIKAEDTIKSRIKDIDRVKKQLKDYINVIEQGVKDQENKIEKAKSALKDLGVDNKEIAQFEKQLNFIKKYLNNADKLTK